MTATATQLRIPFATLPAPVLPGVTVTLTLEDAALRRAIDAAAGGQVAFRVPRSGAEQSNEIVLVAHVPSTGTLPGGAQAAIIQVDARARLQAIHPSERGADFADVELIGDPRPTPRIEASARELAATLQLIAELRRSRRLPEILRAGLEPGPLADAAVAWAELDEGRRLHVLDLVDVEARVEFVLGWAKEHLAELQVAETIRNDVSEGVDKQQREYLLRQQLAAIRKELGEGDDDVVAQYRERLENLDAAEKVKLAIDRELDRLERTSSQSPEHGWIRTWLDRIFELPWGTRTDDTLDLTVATKVLDDDHYGLHDVKDRIVEFLAVHKLRHERGVQTTGRGSGAIITLVGPPGVGKTSLGESIARAMDRKFVRVALGGIRDEAEVRGHRRTYVGSQPGRIARALTEAGTMNPVILLDEVDKLAPGGWSGDPTSALLEVLDPAQNHTFRDHYLEVDLDLSEVVFIATANVADTIPGPLLDRMELVRLDGYTEDEKVFIARRYLLPRQLDRAGLKPDELDVPDAVILAAIRGYTREAGVRGLERTLGTLARKAAAKIAAGAATPLAVPDGELSDWIGRAKIV
ncbi:MAG TPA: AAA family ATPase, partial [Ilumatobacter sp.]|nr:AAA family ATPase [Ilumatobacter sp.]